MNKISFETKILPQKEGQYEQKRVLKTNNYENDTQLALLGMFGIHFTYAKNNKSFLILTKNDRNSPRKAELWFKSFSKQCLLKYRILHSSDKDFYHSITLWGESRMVK